MLSTSVTLCILPDILQFSFQWSEHFIDIINEITKKQKKTTTTTTTVPLGQQQTNNFNENYHLYLK